MILCRHCGSELWWAGALGIPRYLHVTKTRPDHEGQPR
jgi:hypothetical protein